jgi:agmatine/peptidylarginine deiminase
MRNTIFGSFISLAMVFSTVAQAAPVHRFTPEENAKMSAHNESLAGAEFIKGLYGNIDSKTKAISVIKTETVPVAEYDEAGYLIISDQTPLNTLEVKHQLAKNLPANMTLVVFTGIRNKGVPASIVKGMAPYISADRIKAIYLPTGKNGFWARDGVPVPVWQVDNTGNKVFTVVDAKYYHEFEADKEVANYFGADLLKHDYYYEGGNYLANSKGDCVVIQNDRVVKMPDSVFEDMYGCKTLIRLPFLTNPKNTEYNNEDGIGHVDERVKFVNDTTVLTDRIRYRDILEKAGFKVIMLPAASGIYETYVNSLIANGVVYIPVFNEATDAAAVKVYADLGLKTVPLDSVALSNDGMGSIHCITMTYPKVPLAELAAAVGGTVIK